MARFVTGLKGDLNRETMCVSHPVAETAEFEEMTTRRKCVGDDCGSPSIDVIDVELTKNVGIFKLGHDRPTLLNHWHTTSLKLTPGGTIDDHYLTGADSVIQPVCT